METRVVTSMAKSHDDVLGLPAVVKSALGGEKAKLALVFASMEHDLAALLTETVHALPGVIVLGATTAGEFTEKGDAKRAASIFALAGDYHVVAGIGRGLKANPEKAVAKALEGLPRKVVGYKHSTAILLLDPMAGNGEETTLAAAAMLGEGVKLAGGAAGDDLEMASSEVGLGSEVVGDAVVIALVFSNKPLGVGVSHGHTALSAPLKITKASGNVVFEIDGRPAWEVWLEKTGRTGPPPAKREEGAYLLTYEAGLAAGDQLKIRAPLSKNEDGSIAFACGIPQGAVIRITESTPARQIASAAEAARRARLQLGPSVPAGALVFDCICRAFPK